MRVEEGEGDDRADRKRGQPNERRHGQMANGLASTENVDSRQIDRRKCRDEREAAKVALEVDCGYGTENDRAEKRHATDWSAAGSKRGDQRHGCGESELPGISEIRTRVEEVREQRSDREPERKELVSLHPSVEQ